MTRNELLKQIAIKLGGTGNGETQNELLKEIATLQGAVNLKDARNELLQAYLDKLGG